MNQKTILGFLRTRAVSERSHWAWRRKKLKGVREQDASEDYGTVDSAQVE